MQSPASDSALLSQPSKARLRVPFLDGIRALCALSVVLQHESAESHHASSLVVSALQPFNLAVGVFIVVSGYSLGLGAANGKPVSYATFVRRRAWRILPPYLAALAISVVLILTLIGKDTGTHWDNVLPLSWFGVMTHTLLVQDIFGGRAPDFVFWSIAIEWHLYFAFPLLWKLRNVRNRMFVLAAGAIATGLLWRVWAGSPWSGFPPQFALLFVVGLLAADISTATDSTAQRMRKLLTLRNASTLFFISILPVLVLIKLMPDYFVGTVGFGVAVAALIVALTQEPSTSRARAALEWRPLVAIGTFSYSLYLIHAPVLQLVDQYLVSPLGLNPQFELVFMMVGGTAFSLAGAYAFHCVFERPFLKQRSLATLLRRENTTPSENSVATAGEYVAPARLAS